MKRTLVSKILKVLLICVFTIEIGITVGYVILLNIDFKHSFACLSVLNIKQSSSSDKSLLK